MDVALDPSPNGGQKHYVILPLESGKTYSGHMLGIIDGGFNADVNAHVNFVRLNCPVGDGSFDDGSFDAVLDLHNTERDGAFIDEKFTCNSLSLSVRDNSRDGFDAGGTRTRAVVQYTESLDVTVEN